MTTASLAGFPMEVEMQPHAHCKKRPMGCPRCGHADLRCRQTSNGKINDKVLRDRICLECGFKFTTVEMVRGGLTREELKAQPDWRETEQPKRKKKPDRSTRGGNRSG